MQSKLNNKSKMRIESNEKTSQEICRLCLKSDNLFVNIYNDDKNMSLDGLLFDLFNIKVEQTDVYPANICFQCLYMTKTFFGFRENVKKCDAKLKSDFALINKTKTLEDHINEEDYQVIIVNPYQEHESSEDEFSDTEFHEISETHNNNTENIVITSSENENLPSGSNNSSFEVSTMEVDTIIDCKNTFHCMYCDMAFAQRIDCNEHESRHDAAKPYICHFCPFRATSRQNLINHIKTGHNNERPYVCSLCSKGFCRRSDLKKHTVVHTGVRPFTCHICGKRFSRNTNLKKHSRIHTGTKVYSFPNSSKSFKTARKFIQKNHSDNKSKILDSTLNDSKIKLNQNKNMDNSNLFIDNNQTVQNLGQYADQNFNRTSNFAVEPDVSETINRQIAMPSNQNFSMQYEMQNNENKQNHEIRTGMNLQRFPEKPSLQLGFYNEVELDQ